MILDREQRASDLATKADRDISPKLTDEQYHALLHYTFKAGFKHPVQLLEAFVGDLSGWHRNGSDEEELAGEWFVKNAKQSEKTQKTKIVLVSATYNIGFIAAKLGVEYLSKRAVINFPDSYISMVKSVFG